MSRAQTEGNYGKTSVGTRPDTGSAYAAPHFDTGSSGTDTDTQTETPGLRPHPGPRRQLSCSRNAARRAHLKEWNRLLVGCFDTKKPHRTWTIGVSDPLVSHFLYQFWPCRGSHRGAA